MTAGVSYFSVCSGIEAATVAWHPLGWRAVGYAEIDKFACAVLADRYGSNLPGEALSSNAPPNYGDFTQIEPASLGRVDVLVGGTPCQAFSLAGSRGSLRDARGNLTLAYAVLAHELARSNGLRNALWENVPGVLSTDDNAFGCFLGALVGADDPIALPEGVGRWPDSGMVAGPRARLAWRVLDAQYFGLAQRRERVFVVVDFGNGADPCEVLFEPKGLQGNFAPRRETGEGFTRDVAPCLTSGGRGVERAGETRGQDPVVAEFRAFGGGNRSGDIPVAATLTTKNQRNDFEVETFIAHVPLLAHTLRGEGFDASEDGTGRGVPLVALMPTAFNAQGGGKQTSLGFDVQSGVAGTLSVGQQVAVAYSEPIAFDTTQITSKANRSNPQPGDPCHTLARGAHAPAIASGYAVRRLTPIECARLQGFPDHHSRIAWRGKPAEECPDGPQYKTFGNSMAVDVMAWLGARLDAALRRVAS